MRFKLLEYENNHETEILTDIQVKKMLETTHKEADRPWAAIYRGVNIGPENLSYLVTPNPANPRMSANTYNYYTLIINNAHAWKEFPKREIICTTNENSAWGFGDVYRVFPQNGAKIGICPRTDIWLSDFDSGAHILDNLFRVFKVKSLGPDRDYRQFVKACSVVDENKKVILRNDRDGRPYFASIDREKLKQYVNGNVDLIDYIQQEFFNPGRGGFRAEDIRLFSTDNRDHEVWTDAPCLLIPYND